MSRTLAVTTPLMHGPDVRLTQELLNGRNIFEHDYLAGRVDGIFGPESGRGAYRAKYWLGYPDAELKHTAGDMLRNLLSGKTELPATYKRRRTIRLRAQQQKPLREKALEIAGRDVGKVENPKDSNKISYTARWGVIGPYCNMAVSIWYIAAGSKAFTIGDDYAYVPYMLADAYRGHNNLALIRVPKLGDIFCADWDDDGIADHTGLVRGPILPNGNFQTREANTTAGPGGNQSDGGGVYDRVRNIGDVAKYQGSVGFIHVGK